MKGTFFQKPLELSLVVEGESWQQGDSMSGTLQVRNHGGAAVSLSGLHVDLCVGELKKVRGKSADAFKILQTQAWTGPESIAAGATHSMDWKFATDLNFPITDSWASPFLVYGQGDAADRLGNLQLTFRAAPAIQDFLDVFKTAFRFVTKSQRSLVKGTLEVKLAPPDGQAYSKFEQVAVSFCFGEDETLELAYSLQTKKIVATVAGSETKKVTKKHEQTFRRDQYRLASGRIRHDVFEAAIREALEAAVAADPATS